MTPLEAKRILMLYRPGTADADDPEFAEALRLCERDPELQAWFDAHCQLYQSLSSRFHGVAVPEGLREQIIAERPPDAKHHQPIPVRRAIVAAVALSIIAAVLIAHWTRPVENTGFAGFRNRMIGTALRSYGMDLETENLDRIRGFLSGRDAVADFTLPEGLERARILGCLATTWQNKPVSMLCFHTQKSTRAGTDSDLWLFVARLADIPDAPRSSAPVIEQVNSICTAYWTDGNRIYVLAMEGKRENLEPFL